MSTFILPSGITEEYFISTVKDITDKIAEKFSFGYYDANDIAQESYIEAMNAISRFDPSRGSLASFLSTHLRNRLINLRRNKLTRIQSPCLTCQHCDSDEEKLNCPKYIRWKKRNDAKRSLMESEYNDGEDFSYDDSVSTCDDDSLFIKEMRTIIDRELPVEYRADYCRYITGDKIPKKKLDKMLYIVREILEKYGYSI